MAPLFWLVNLGSKRSKIVPWWLSLCFTLLVVEVYMGTCCYCQVRQERKAVARFPSSRQQTGLDGLSTVLHFNMRSLHFRCNPSLLVFSFLFLSIVPPTMSSKSTILYHGDGGAFIGRGEFLRLLFQDKVFRTTIRLKFSTAQTAPCVVSVGLGLLKTVREVTNKFFPIFLSHHSLQRGWRRRRSPRHQSSSSLHKILYWNPVGICCNHSCRREGTCRLFYNECL